MLLSVMFRTRAVRLSLLYSTVRVISPSSVLHKVTRVIAILFFLVWATLIALKTWWCVIHTKPTAAMGTERPVCVLPELTVLFELISRLSKHVFIDQNLIVFTCY